MSEIGYVYTLNDPRTGEPKYVGATKHPKTRYYGHVSGSTSPKVQEWIDELTDEGKRPQMTLIHIGELENLPEKERELIQSLSDEWELLNERNISYPKQRSQDEIQQVASIEIEFMNPDTHGTKTVDGQGRLYLGKRYAEKDVKFTIEVIEE